MDGSGELYMYVEEGLKQFYVAGEDGWILMPGSRFFVSQATEGGRIQEPFALIFDTSGDSGEIGLLVMPERSGTPFAPPHYVDRKAVLETGEDLKETALRIMAAVLDDSGNSLQRLQEDIEERRQEMIEFLGPME